MKNVIEIVVGIIAIIGAAVGVKTYVDSTFVKESQLKELIGKISQLNTDFSALSQNTTGLETQIGNLKSELEKLSKISKEDAEGIAPTITLIEDVTDERGAQIDKSKAPFKIRVKGTVSNAKNLNVYLVVDDANAQWIQPTAGFGPNVDKEFSGYFHLGIKDDPASLNKLYKVFAVVTSKEYKEYDHLDRKTIKAQSNVIELTRTK